MKSPEELKKENIEAEESGEVEQEVDVTELEKREIPVHSQQDSDFLKGKIAEILGHSKAEADDFDIELNRILDWAKTKGADSIEDILWEVRYLATRLGTPGLGESRIKWLYQYIFLENEEQIIQDKRRRMEGLKYA